MQVHSIWCRLKFCRLVKMLINTIVSFSDKVFSPLTLSSIYTQFNTMKKKLWENIVGKGEIAHFEQFHPSSIMFSMQSVSTVPLIATSQLSSASSLNLGRSQNGVLGNGLNKKYLFFHIIRSESQCS